MQTLIETIMLRILAEVTDFEGMQSAVSSIRSNPTIDALLRRYIERAIELHDAHEMEIQDVKTGTVDPYLFNDLVDGDRRQIIARIALTGIVRKIAKNHSLSAEDEEKLVDLFDETIKSVPGSMTIGVEYEMVSSYDDIDGVISDRMIFLDVSTGLWDPEGFGE